jgi:hypothetical protein
MKSTDFLSHLSIIFAFLFAVLVGCQAFGPRIPEPGIDEPILIGAYSIQIISAEIRNSYSTYYIMHYPAGDETFYEVTTELDGFDDPKSALAWGEENLKLTAGADENELAYAHWSLLGDDIKYEADEPFVYQFHFFFIVPRETDYTQYRLKLTDNYAVNPSQILNIPPHQSPLPEERALSDGLEVSPLFATLGGGSKNLSEAYHSTVAGGHLNTALSAYAAIGGGRENQADNLYATVSGGYANSASGRDASIGGGSRNYAGNYHTTIGGGIRNLATASDSTISGGAYNTASQTFAVVGGGTRNSASGSAAVVAGGAGNLARMDQSTVSGGLNNHALGIYAAIGGGYSNAAIGDYSTVSGGALNQVRGKYGFAAGYRGVVDENHDGVILFSDSNDVDFHSANSDEFGVRATGGVRFVSAIDNLGNPTAGVILPPGSGSWSNLSDRHMKENITPVDHKRILESVLSLEISEWNYISQNPSIRHIGPMADEFYAAFGTGSDEYHISSVDADGISLAAIQGLYQLLNEQNEHITKLENQIETLQKSNRSPTIVLITSLLSAVLGMSFLPFFQGISFRLFKPHELKQPTGEVTKSS